MRSAFILSEQEQKCMTPFHRADRLAFTALVTPFEGETVSYDALGSAIARQVVANLDGVIVGDVVGEGQTLSSDEHDDLLRACVAHGKRQLSVIAATGTYCTADTIERSRGAERIGADALLVTVPYYSKPTLAGVVNHFLQVAEAVSVPIVIDDDPGRTGKDFGPALLEKLEECRAIAGVCHGIDRLAHFSGLSSRTRNRFVHLTRDDTVLAHFLNQGGNGCISSVANVIPSSIQTMVTLGESYNGAVSMTDEVACAVAAIGRDDVAALKEAASFIHQAPAEVRLPLVPSEPETIIRVRQAYAPFARCENPMRDAA
jgi:4-hydroxy-tetrahydrodipicolinate synthase